mmetsp:Transcript_14583/g.15755  ORF Transcript_14583/g.15755 Transcript_14583/m.15755 type:complete len:118 (-) Transcript_14583:431-784(-)
MPCRKGTKKNQVDWIIFDVSRKFCAYSSLSANKLVPQLVFVSITLATLVVVVPPTVVVVVPTAADDDGDDDDDDDPAVAAADNDGIPWFISFSTTSSSSASLSHLQMICHDYVILSS